MSDHDYIDDGEHDPPGKKIINDFMSCKEKVLYQEAFQLKICFFCVYIEADDGAVENAAEAAV